MAEVKEAVDVWQGELKSAVKGYLKQPTREQRQLITELLEPTEEEFWQAVREVIKERHEAETGYKSSGRSVQDELKEAQEQVLTYNRYIKEAKWDFTKNFYQEQLEYWQGIRGSLQKQLIERVTSSGGFRKTS